MSEETEAPKTTGMTIKAEAISCPHCGLDVPHDAARSYKSEVEMWADVHVDIVAHLDVCREAPPGAAREFVAYMKDCAEGRESPLPIYEP